MQSLQVLTPHQKCLFNCPFCIADSHEHKNDFVNNYQENNQLWQTNLINVIKNNPDLKYVVITGTNEPMQSIDCVKDIIRIVKNVNKNVNIEIQTRYYHESEVFNLFDVVAYSVASPKLFNKIPVMGKKIRYVLILTDEFNNYSLADLLKLLPPKVEQVTFKVLHDSGGINGNIDDYVAKHGIDKATLAALIKDINSYKGQLSLKYDAHCMEAEGRYKIFREDGRVYANWDAIKDISASYEKPDMAGSLDIFQECNYDSYVFLEKYPEVRDLTVEELKVMKTLCIVASNFGFGDKLALGIASCLNSIFKINNDTWIVWRSDERRGFFAPEQFTNVFDAGCECIRRLALDKTDTAIEQFTLQAKEEGLPFDIVKFAIEAGYNIVFNRTRKSPKI